MQVLFEKIKTAIVWAYIGFVTVCMLYGEAEKKREKKKWKRKERRKLQVTNSLVVEIGKFPGEKERPWHGSMT